MIPAPAITAWSLTAPWPTRGQIEQDLLLSRLIIEIANDHYLGQELVFRGGTCLHKLHLHPARRYSEDLDYVRTSGTGIKEMTTALTRIGQAHDVQIRTRIGVHPKVYFRGQAEDGSPLRIKIEINTHERSPAAGGPRSSSRIDLGLGHPAPQRLRVDPELLADPGARPARAAGSFRASSVSRIARSRSSSGYFRGAAILGPPWLDGLHQTRHETANGRPGRRRGLFSVCPARVPTFPRAAPPRDALMCL